MKNVPAVNTLNGKEKVSEHCEHPKKGQTYSKDYRISVRYDSKLYEELEAIKANGG